MSTATPPPEPTPRLLGRIVGITRTHLVIAMGFEDIEVPMSPSLDHALVASFFNKMAVVEIHDKAAATIKSPTANPPREPK